MFIKPYLLIIVGLLFLTSGCYYDNKEELYPNECDTVNVSFSGDVMPIIVNHCNNCHSGNAAASFGGGISLEDYTMVKATVVDSSLKGSIEGDENFEKMPIDYSLDNCDIEKINAWINNDSPNN